MILREVCQEQGTREASSLGAQGRITRVRERISGVHATNLVHDQRGTIFPIYGWTQAIRRTRIRVWGRGKC